MTQGSGLSDLLHGPWSRCLACVRGTAPGHGQQVKVIINSKDGFGHRIAIAATAQPSRAATGAAVSPTVAAVYKVNGGPNPLWKSPKAIPHPTPPAPGFPWGPVGVGVLGAALLGGLVALARKFKISVRR